MDCPLTDDDRLDWLDGETPQPRLDEIARHVAGCEECRRRLEALRRADALVRADARELPPHHATVAARRALEPLLRPAPREILTLDEVRAMLRVDAGAFGELVEQLPAFEVAGQVRVRRAALMEWIAHREQDYRRERNASWIARCTSVA